MEGEKNGVHVSQQNLPFKHTRKHFQIENKELSKEFSPRYFYLSIS